VKSRTRRLFRKGSVGARGRKPGSLHSADSGRDDTKKDDAGNFGETRGNLTPNPFPCGKGDNPRGVREVAGRAGGSGVPPLRGLRSG
jgi:hypothetical protein